MQHIALQLDPIVATRGIEKIRAFRDPAQRDTQRRKHQEREIAAVTCDGEANARLTPEYHERDAPVR